VASSSRTLEVEAVEDEQTIPMPGKRLENRASRKFERAPLSVGTPVSVNSSVWSKPNDEALRLSQRLSADSIRSEREKRGRNGRGAESSEQLSARNRVQR
jgi:hypothetical protein